MLCPKCQNETQVLILTTKGQLCRECKSRAFPKQCRVEGCTNSVKETDLPICEAHWSMVPHRIQASYVVKAPEDKSVFLGAIIKRLSEEPAV
jgi:hypothetical protein